MMIRSLFIAAFVMPLATASAADPAGIEFFEKSVRPVLLENCASCHGVKKQSAGLRLDTVAGIRKGADDGPIYVAGKVKESRMIRAINHDGETAMPPEKKLPAEAIAAITAWVERGAPMPEEKAVTTKIDPKSHWAFQPVRNPVVPKLIPDGGNEIDAFVIEKLSAKGLKLAPPADPRTLIRRVYIDMIGLPPTFDEVEQFAQDSSPAAYAKLVDKLLASPQYGERWARHWLDVARYSDTKGYVFTEDRNFPFAYTFRDYVIRSLNEDKPYSQFVIEQIAADRLKLGEDNRALAAMGYLTLGRRFNNNTHDIIDDRIEVVTRGFLGLSVGCARCHDHKFDPVPIGDYYSLYGVFASSVEPGDLPLLSGQIRTKESDAYDAEIKKLEDAADAFRTKMIADALAKFRTARAVEAYLLAVHDLKNQPANRVAELVQQRKLHTTIVERWRKVIAAADAKTDPVFQAWHAFSALDVKADAKAFEAVRRRVLASATLHASVYYVLVDAEVTRLEDVAALYGELFAEAGRDSKHDAMEKAFVDILNTTTHYEISGNNDEQFVEIAVKNKYRALRNAAQAFRATSPLAPPRAMTLADAPKPMEPVVFLRGNPENRGPKVPRQFLSLLSGDTRKPFQEGSGRLELATAIADPANPLTARVMVNRVWAWHFGQGLVKTPSDFGVRSDPPTHPELLDWLATKFQTEDGGSLKKLHRRILMSATYRQSSAVAENLLTADPDNSLLSRSPRRRLEFEPLRDAMLAASGTLDASKVGGRSEDIFKTPFTHRRSVYMFIERQNLPGTLRSFDLASPDAHSPQRFRTTVPQQALFMMNSPFAAEMARSVLARPDVRDAANEYDKLTALVRAILARNPTDAERGLMTSFLQQSPKGSETTLGPWEQLAQALMMSNEFAHTD